MTKLDLRRKTDRALLRAQHDFVDKLPKTLTSIPPEEFPQMRIMPIQAWRSRDYLIQLFQESNLDYPGMMRLSACRVKLGANGRWQDALTWDELQAIKREVGFGDWYAIEIYPPDREVVNVANFRHLWLLPEPLSIGF